MSGASCSGTKVLVCQAGEAVRRSSAPAFAWVTRSANWSMAHLHVLPEVET